MKNQKIILVFALVAIFLLVMANLVQATNNVLTVNPPNEYNGQQAGNNAEGNNAVGNNTPVNNAQANNTLLANNSANNTLPQTGVTEDTTLFVFITICVVSAIYAFIKIKNYKNI